MESIFVRGIEDIIRVDKDSIEIDEIFGFFFKHPDRTLYVTERKKYNNDKVIGIITQGDFRRYLDGRKSVLCNDRFTTCSLGDEKNVNTIFEEKKKILSVPIIDEAGEIVREYYRLAEQKSTEEYFSFAFVESIYQEALLSSYDINIFVLDALSEGQKESARQIHQATAGKVIITDDFNEDFADFYNSEEKRKQLWVYEMRTEKMELWDLFYQRKNINHLCLHKDRMETIRNLKYLSGFFDKVGYLDINFDIKRRLCEVEDNCEKFQLKDFLWDKELECYRYMGNDDSAIEVLITYLKLSNDTFYAVMGDRYVPIISMFCDYVRVPNAGRQISDEDIAFNIIPKLQKNGVTCIVIEDPQKNYDALPETEKFISHKTQWGIFDYKIGGKEHESFWTENGKYNKEFLDERKSWSAAFSKGFLQIGNMYGEYINYFDGERYTCGNPEKYNNTIYLFGSCHVWGSVLSDEHTLGSYMRERINKQYYIKNCGGVWENINYILRSHIYKAGDVAVVFASRSEAYELQGIPLYSIWEAFQKLPDPKLNLWDSLYHGNYIAVSCIAEVLQKIINDKLPSSYIGSQEDISVSFGRNTENSLNLPEGLKKWLRDVRQYKVSHKGKAGAIVMNCNPFTLGHRYLVEEAKKRVEVLYLFVVEENKSFFDFQDRLNMVRLGVQDMEDVIVIPSGGYIISSATLPGYFEKEEKPEAEFDATEDLGIFGKIIAKDFGIQIRFAGEEPSDKFTNRYNEFMSTLLPKYGVEFCEIPRKTMEGEVISASKVRGYMKDRKYEQIKDLTLPCIYEYLEKHYFL